MKWPIQHVKFDSALQDETPGQQKLQRNQYSEQGNLPVVDQGQKLVGGYCSDESLVYSGPLPAIVFGDHTLALKYIDFPFVLGADGVRVLSAKKHFDTKFLFYYLQSAKLRSQGYARHFKLLRTIEFPLITLLEQRRIVELLDQADSLRRKRADADDLAARILPSLFRKMFGDPARNPKGWKISNIGQVSSLVTSGLTPRGGEANYTKSGPIFLRSQNIQMNQLQLDDVACLPEEVHFSMERTHVRFGDVLLNITGASIGRVAWYDMKDKEANVNQHVCIIRLNETALPEYVSVFLSMPYGQMLINGAQTGATRQGLNHESVRRIPLPLPPVVEQTVFAEIVTKLRQNEAQCCLSSLNIETLFQTMLHRAFTSELTSGWREAHMKELLAEMELQSKALGKLEEAA